MKLAQANQKRGRGDNYIPKLANREQRRAHLRPTLELCVASQCCRSGEDSVHPNPREKTWILVGAAAQTSSSFWQQLEENLKVQGNFSTLLWFAPHLSYFPSQPASMKDAPRCSDRALLFTHFHPPQAQSTVLPSEE